MSQITAFVLTILAGVVVVLTRLRLRHSHAGLPLAVHTRVGVAALVLWTVFLVFPDGDGTFGTVVGLVGVLGLGCWWVVSLAGLLLLWRWKPSRSRGKRAAATVSAADTWTESAWLSALAHVGMTLGVLWFTYAYVTSAV